MPLCEADPLHRLSSMLHLGRGGERDEAEPGVISRRTIHRVAAAEIAPLSHAGRASSPIPPPP